MESLNEQVKRMQRIAGIKNLNENMEPDANQMPGQEAEPEDMFDAAEKLGRDGFEDWLESNGISQTQHLEHPSELWLNSWHLSDDGREIYVRRNSLRNLTQFNFDASGNYEGTIDRS